MPEESRNVKIRVKSGESEAEVEASLSNIREAIGLIPEVLAKIPSIGAGRVPASVRFPAESGPSNAREPAPEAGQPASAPSSIPVVTIERGDSLSDVISKFFSDQWGGSPRKLMEVREALQSYGLNYPKQSVAVALLRLAKGSKIRRFKGESGEYVYTAITGATRISMPARPLVEEEAAPEPAAGEEPEEQLNLDAPTAK